MAINTDYLTVRELIEIETLPAYSLLGRDEGLTCPIPQDRFQPADPPFAPSGQYGAYRRKYRGRAATGPSPFQIAGFNPGVNPGQWAMGSFTYVGTVRAVITGNVLSGMGATILNFAGGSGHSVVSSTDFVQFGSPIISMEGTSSIYINCEFTTGGAQSSPRLIFWEVDLIVAGDIT